MILNGNISTFIKVKLNIKGAPIYCSDCSKNNYCRFLENLPSFNGNDYDDYFVCHLFTDEENGLEYTPLFLDDENVLRCKLCNFNFKVVK